MLTVTYRKKGIKLSHVWFSTPEEIISQEYWKNAGDLIFLHGSTTEPWGGTLYTIQHTLIKDLQPSEEELFSSLGKHVRQYIKRSERENLVEIKLIGSQELKTNLCVLTEIGRLYEKMKSDKGMVDSFNLSLATHYIELGALTVAIAYFNNQAVGFSAIVHDRKAARLWLSAFDFRNSQFDNQVLSRAHQRLDWELIKWCKKSGMTSFDFGGVNSFEEPNGVAKFKLGFESKNCVTYYNYLIPNSLIGKIALRIFLQRR